MKNIFWFIGKTLVFLVLVFFLLNVGLVFQNNPIVHSDWYGVKVEEIKPKLCTLENGNLYIGTPFPFYYKVGSGSCYDVYFSFYGLILSIFTLSFIGWFVFFKLDKILKKFFS